MVRGRKSPGYLGLASRLEKARKEAGLDQRPLSVAAGLGHSAVQRIVTTQQAPGLDTVERLADVLGLSPGYLAYGEEHAFVAAPAPRRAGVAARLRQARLARGLASRALGEAASTSHTAILNIEDGRIAPRLDTIERLARALGVRPGWLAFGCGADPGF